MAVLMKCRAPWGTLFMNFAPGPDLMASTVGTLGRSARASPKLGFSPAQK